METESLFSGVQALVPAPDEGRGPVSLLLVDDNPTFLRILRRFIEADGGTAVQVVGTAGGGAEALVMAVVLRPRLVVMDLAMPDLHGLEVLPRLRRLLPEAGIITLTLLNPKTYRAIALAAGADEFVAKVTLETDLLPAIRRVADATRARGTADGARFSQQG